MKIKYLILAAIACTGCSQDQKKEHTTMDFEAEYTAIEATREKVQEAIKNADRATVRKFATDDVITVGPGTNDWSTMYANSRPGRFPYDSIIMMPKETVIVSDSIAYDFGNSRVFYTDSLNNVIELRDTFLVILKKGKDGIWRLHREVASGRVQ